MTRSFVALSLPDGPRGGLARVQEACPAGRLVDPEDFHVTLAFLDNLDDLTLVEVHDALGAVRAPGFTLRIAGLGVFGGTKPRALYAVVLRDAALDHLQARVTAAARQAGAEVPARRFVPHVTIARFPRDFEETPAFGRFVAAHVGLSLAPFPVRYFGLYASHRRSDGATYEELATYHLEPMP